MIRIKKVCKELAKRRPVFHSEADFQCALAWEIHSLYPSANIILEKRVAGIGHIDIWIELERKIFAIEMKYKTRRQGALPIGRYSFVKDIERLERCVAKYHNGVGYAIMLTNEGGYWRKTKSHSLTADINFRIHDGRKLGGKLKWGPSARRLRRGRPPLILGGSYTLDWSDYSKEFRYLSVRVPQ